MTHVMRASAAPGAGDDVIPVIDLGPSRSGDPATRAALGHRIDEVCRNSGLFVVVNHGVDPGLVEHLYEVTLDFFSRPGAWKRRFAAVAGDATARGWSCEPLPANPDAPLRTAPALREQFVASRLGEPGIGEQANLGAHLARYSSPNVWPDEPGDFRDTWLRYYGALDELTRTLMRTFALGLSLPERWFDPYFDNHLASLCATYSPPCEQPVVAGPCRRAPHRDAGTLTVLWHDGTAGLEVLDRHGVWWSVPVVAGSFVVNVGDLMARWTNDRWVAAVRRVAAAAGDRSARARVSVAFLHQPNWDARLECLPSCRVPGEAPRYGAVTSGEYLLATARPPSP